MVLGLFLIVFFLPRLIEIDRFVATDEGAWLYRSGDFLYALGQRDFAETYQKYHPGVITTWAGAAALLVEFPDYYKLGQGYFEAYQEFEEFLVSHDVLPYDVMVTGRVIQVVFIGIVGALCLFIMMELVGTLPAGAAFLLLAVDPFFVALTRMFHLDGVMSVLVLLSLVVFLFSSKLQDKGYFWLVLSGLAFGLGALEKITSVLIVPVVLLGLVLDEIKNIREDGKSIKSGVGEFILKSLVWGGAGLAVFVTFWPVMWVEPFATAKQLLGAATGTTAGNIQTSTDFIQPTIFLFYNPLHKSWMNYLAAFIWRSSPVIIAGLIAAIAAWVSSVGAWQKPQVKKMSSLMVVFSVIYLIFMTSAAKQSQKYLLPALLMIIIIAGLGIYSILEILKKIFPGIWGVRAGVGLVIIGLVVQIGLMLAHAPYYWTYYNPLLGGSERAGRSIFVGTGEGLDLAGEYLNSKPNAEELTVMSWYGTGCLSYFFDGEVVPLNDNPWKEADYNRLAGADYLVLYSNLWFRNRPDELLESLTGVEPEKRIWLHEIEYARIYAVEELPADLRGE